MKLFLILVLSVFHTGCVIYLDRPIDQVVSGKVVSDTGNGVANATVTIWEGRTYITFVPISYPDVAKTMTDIDGNFEVSVKNTWPARISANKECSFGYVQAEEKDITRLVIKLENRCSEE